MNHARETPQPIRIVGKYKFRFFLNHNLRFLQKLIVKISLIIFFPDNDQQSNEFFLFCVKEYI